MNKPAVQLNATLWLIEGKNYSIGSFISMGKDRGLELTSAIIYQRLLKGACTIDEVLTPPSPTRQNATRKVRSDKRAEMAELLARMGPPKRY